MKMPNALPYAPGHGVPGNVTASRGTSVLPADVALQH